MSPTRDRLTSIPVRATTLKLLEQLKTGTQNWDDFLLSAFEEIPPPDTVAELDRRERDETSRPFADLVKAHPVLARRSRVRRDA
ncbi:MAG: hypothetical protein WAN87_04035 [Thermoplasmata archaeon]